MSVSALISTPKIIPRIFGGIGNQLFIYAAARRLALVNNAELVLDDVSGFVHDYDYQRHYQLDHFHIPCRKATAEEHLEPFSRIRRYLKRRINEYRPFEDRAYIQQQSAEFDSRLLSLQPLGTLYLEGYWQSEHYFKDVEATIRQDLKIQPPTDASNQAMCNLIQSHKSVAVHVRFFDQPHVDGVNNAPIDYYSSAIVEMARRVPNAHYYLFSDRPDIARDLIPLPEGHFTVVAHNSSDTLAYADLWLMTHCKHFIIANSTFSWWGAWLGTYKGKQVIAPGFEIRQGKMSWGFKGLLPGNWTKL